MLEEPHRVYPMEVEVTADIKTLLETDLPDFEAELEAAGAPWTPGRKLPE
ncbi:MAG: hypothetical protein O7A98_06525 [Acidobacteria bacterium]|nr:hypothetical protein [Acidobacteriota bacterium]